MKSSKEPPSLRSIELSVLRLIKKARKERKQYMQDLATSIIRTLVPFIVGAIVSFLVGLGITVEPELQAQLSGFLTFFFGALYYILVRLISKKFPKVEWLLGIPSKPEYK